MDETFSVDPAMQGTPRSGGSTILRVLGIGCLVIFLLLAGISVYIYMTWRSWTVYAVNMAMTESLKTSGFSEADQQSIRQAVGKVTTRFESGEMTSADFQKLVENFIQGPLFMKILFQEFTNQYVLTSKLSIEEKVNAALHLNRILRGWAEKKIPQNEVNDFLSIFPDIKEETPKKLTDEEIRNIIKKAEALSDKFEIIKEEFQLDIAKALEEMIEESLKK